jgi:hypothetical protein
MGLIGDLKFQDKCLSITPVILHTSVSLTLVASARRDRLV